MILLRQFARLRVCPHVESDDEATGGLRQNDIGFGNAADRTVHDAHLDFICRQFLQRSDNGLDRPLDVAPDNNRQFLRLARLDLVEHLLEGTPAADRECLLPLRALPVIGNFTGPGLILDRNKLVASQGRTLQSENFDRFGRSSRLNRLSTVVDQGAHAAPLAAGDKDIALI